MLTAPVCAPHLGQPATPPQMLEARLLHDTDTSGWRTWFDAAGAPDLHVARGPVFEDFNLLCATTLAAQGVALCPLAIIADDIAAGRLVQLSDTAIRRECGYYVLIAADPARQRTPVLAAFADWLLSTAPGP